MITTKLTELPKSTAELEITISWDEIKDVYEKIFSEVAGKIEVEGFRKGKAPKKVIEEKINKTKVYEEVIKEIVPKAYAKAVSEHKLKPVSSPKIEVVQAKENIEWKIKATLALMPKIILKNYKEKIKEAKSGKAKIWTPGATEDKKKDSGKLALEEIIKILLSEIEIELSDILIAEETNRLLANLVDQTQKLGLTIEQYLISKDKTTENLRSEYAQQAASNLKLEFALASIADQENIVVNDKDIENLIEKAEKPEEKEKLNKERYYLAHLLRQQKTLEFLNNL
jgi:FKBP-type peptidyl-prolyl cis-trans isomerase (trigger factor)